MSLMSQINSKAKYKYQPLTHTYYNNIFYSRKSMKVHLESDQEEQYVNQNGTMGVQFADINGKSNRVVRKLGPYDPKLKHRTVCNGLNLQGICLNQSCSVFQKYVWVQKGFGEFRIAQQVDNAKCPICNNYLPCDTVKSVGYTEARVKYSGRKQGENKRFDWNDEETKGNLVKFQGYDGKTVHWVFLNLTVTKL